MYTLRQYQRESVDSVYRHLRERDTNPCVVIPTAGGKSLCIAQVAKDAVTLWNGRVMILAHVKELVEQNAAKLASICPELKVGVYSAGLNRRDTEESVIVAGIQSVCNRMDLFRPFDLIMVDEVHMVPPDGEGRYRTFLEAAMKANPNVRLVGWTATPYRTQGGLICKPENLFQEICYEVGIKDLIDRGFLSKITARAGQVRADLTHLHIRAGEFVSEDVEKAMGADNVVESACREIVELTRNRKTCLVFCTSVAHCNRVAKLIERYSGEECAVVTGETSDDERARTIARLRGEKVDVDLFGNAAPPLRYCCNVAVMTTGTDIPGIDTVVLLRPTASPGLLVQAVGRGFRLSPETGKTECLVLDYGRNLERFGPIDMINVKEPTHGGGEPLAKECPVCRRILPLSVMLCPECGHQFTPKERERRQHEGKAAEAAILSGETKVESFDVKHTDYQLWEKRGAPPGSPRTVRVTYWIDMLMCYSEWLCPEHTGYARGKFEKWWREHTRPECPMPRTTEDVIEFRFMGQVRDTKRITVRTVSGQKYPEIVAHELGDFPTPGVPSAETDGRADDDWGDIPF